MNFVSGKIRKFSLKQSISAPIDELIETQLIPCNSSVNNEESNDKLDTIVSEVDKTKIKSNIKPPKKGRGSYNLFEIPKDAKRQRSFRKIKKGHSPGLSRIVGGKKFLDFIKAK